MTGHDFAASLRQLADWYDAHPDFDVPTSVYLDVFVEDRAHLAAAARMLAPAEKVDCGGWFCLRRTFGPIHLDVNIARELVCTKRVTGTRIVPAKPEREVEVVEWDCASPLLGGAS